MHCTRDTIILRRNTAWEIRALLTQLLAQDGMDKGDTSSGLLSFVSGNKLPARAALDIAASALLTLRTTSAFAFDWHILHDKQMDQFDRSELHEKSHGVD